MKILKIKGDLRNLPAMYLSRYARYPESRKLL